MDFEIVPIFTDPGAALPVQAQVAEFAAHGGQEKNEICYQDEIFQTDSLQSRFLNFLVRFFQENVEFIEVIELSGKVVCKVDGRLTLELDIPTIQAKVVNDSEEQPSQDESRSDMDITDRDTISGSNDDYEPEPLDITIDMMEDKTIITRKRKQVYESFDDEAPESFKMLDGTLKEKSMQKRTVKARKKIKFKPNTSEIVEPKSSIGQGEVEVNVVGSMDWSEIINEESPYLEAMDKESRVQFESTYFVPQMMRKLPFKIYECEICKVYKSYRADYLADHIEIKHPRDYQKVIPKNTEPTSVSKSHVKRRRGAKNSETFPCNKCRFTGKTENMLEVHVQNFHENKGPRSGFWKPKNGVIYPCQFCDYVSKSTGYLIEHVKRCHTANLPLKCDKCNTKFKYDANYSKHMEKVHNKSTNGTRSSKGSGELQFKCEACNFGFSRCADYVQHLKDVHGGQVSTKENKIDESEGEGKKKLKHMVKCEQCGYISQCKWMIQRHFNVHHKGDLQYKCKPCGFQYKYNRDYVKHLNGIHGENIVYKKPKGERKTKKKEFKCKQCDFQTKHVGSYYKHVNVIHWKNTLIQCEQCRYASRDKCTVQRHFETHHVGDLQFKCKPCGFQYKYYRGYAKHLNAIHGENIVLTEEQNLSKCAQCSYISKYKDTVERHFDEHHVGDLQFKCEPCGFQYKHYRDYVEHLNDIHSFKNQEETDKSVMDKVDNKLEIRTGKDGRTLRKLKDGRTLRKPKDGRTSKKPKVASSSKNPKDTSCKNKNKKVSDKKSISKKNDDKEFVVRNINNDETERTRYGRTVKRTRSQNKNGRGIRH